MSKNRFNPFTEQIAGKYFVGRESQLDLFINRLNGLKSNVPNHLFIAGIHGTGKTSFLGRISEIAKEHGLLSSITTLDTNKSGYEHVYSIIRAIIKSIQESQKLRVGSKHNFLNDFDSGENSQFFKFPKSKILNSDYINEDLVTIKELVLNQDKRGVVICIDEGQRIESSALSALKNAIQNIDYCLIILSLRLVDSKGGIANAGKAILEKIVKDGEGDYGAARLFVNGIEIGPFETDQEAFECVTKRLHNNVVQYKNEVIQEIIKISERVPREIISLCSDLYNHSQEENIEFVDENAFNKMIRIIYESETAFIEGICSSIPQSQLNILYTLSQGNEMTILEIGKKLYPCIDLLKSEYIKNGIEKDLLTLNENFKIIKVNTESKYSILKPIYTFLIKLYSYES